MKFIEETRDLFTLPQDYLLVHCISADRAMGAGIAKVFRDKYGIRYALYTYEALTGRKWNETDMIGKCVTVRSYQCPWCVANLITKHNYYDKPTYETLKSALEDLKRKNRKPQKKTTPFFNKIGMPLIGCGLDGLKWDKVSEIIKTIFAGEDLDIRVCILD